MYIIYRLLYIQSIPIKFISKMNQNLSVGVLYWAIHRTCHPLTCDCPDFKSGAGTTRTGVWRGWAGIRTAASMAIGNGPWFFCIRFGDGFDPSHVTLDFGLKFGDEPCRTLLSSYIGMVLCCIRILPIDLCCLFGEKQEFPTSLLLFRMV